MTKFEMSLMSYICHDFKVSFNSLSWNLTVHNIMLSFDYCSVWHCSDDEHQHYFITSGRFVSLIQLYNIHFIFIIIEQNVKFEFKKKMNIGLILN